MDVVILLVFVSLALVAAGLGFFFYRLQEGDLDHGERLSLAPLVDDEEALPDDAAAAAASHHDTVESKLGGPRHASR